MSRTILVTASILITASVHAQTNLVRNGDFADGLTGWSIVQDPRCVATVAESSAPGSGRMLCLDVAPAPGEDPWVINLRQTLNAFMDKGHRLVLRAWMRSPEGCRVTPYVEGGRAPWAKSVGQVLGLTPEWKEYELRGTALADYSPGDAGLGFHLGFAKGRIEIAGIQLRNLDETAEMGAPRPTFEKPVSMVGNGAFAGGTTEPWEVGTGERIRADVIETGRRPDERGVRLTCDPAEGAAPWGLQIGQPCNTFVRRGDVIYFRAWLRSPERCQVSFIYELARPPHSKSISQRVKLTPEWREYRFASRVARGFRPGESQAKLFLGHDRGTVEVTDIRVENCGGTDMGRFDQTIDYWGGKEHPDTWRKPALDRIEAIRKGEITVEVTGPDGNPVKDAVIEVEQQRHHFRFGSAVPARHLTDSTNATSKRMQVEIERLFNTVTFENDLKWSSSSPARLEVVDKACDWLEARNITARGHCLLWGSFKHLHKPVRDLRGAELLEACRRHVTEYASRQKGRLYLWDVVNEAGSNVEVWDAIGWEQFADSFKWAREADPGALLCYNDYGIVADNPGYREKVKKRIQFLLDSGVPLDRLGIQAHMGIPLVPPHRVLEILDEWASFGKDLEITEFDLGCRDDSVHAAYVRDFMVAAFSHPDVKAFILWGFWAGAHWRAKDGAEMFRMNWEKRPAQEAYEELVLDTWWTRENGRTGDDGRFRLRAFHGTHDVTIRGDGYAMKRQLDLVPGRGAALRVTVP